MKVEKLSMKPRTLLTILALGTLLIGALGGEALASLCTDLGSSAQQDPGLCTIKGPITAPCPLTLTLPVGDDLLITSLGSLKCDNFNPPSSITITLLSGDMEMQAGSEITVEDNAAGGAIDGGNIEITVNGNFVMRGTGTAADPLALGCAAVAGACISSSDVLGAGGKAGNVTITLGTKTPAAGVFTMEPGSAVLANGVTGGEIEVTAGLEMHIDGLVRSFGRASGTAGRPNGGGPITLKSGCVLEVTPDGVISSEGRDPGADLVHLEGCEVVVNGLVQSIALGNGGHTVPAAGNKCNDDNVVAHPLGGAPAFTACVEIWGNNITINSILPNKGEVSVDGIAGNRAWIDLFAKNNITIINDIVGPYSVHANSGTTTGDFGGVITSKAQTGAYTSSGFAIQANSLAPGSNGGDVTIEASGNVELTDSAVQALGSAAGANPAGGKISARSFNGFVLGNAPGELIATGGPPVGVITLQGCGTGADGDGVNYTGTTNPAATILMDACTGQPALPGPVTAALVALAPICESGACGLPSLLCEKRGTKFQDLDGDGVPREAGEPGLAGWVIRAYTVPGNAFAGSATTDVDGHYAFLSLTCGTYTFCEVLQTGWTQRFPAAAGGDIMSCAAIEPNPNIILGALGYREVLVPGQPSLGNDFGNEAPETCIEVTKVCADATTLGGQITFSGTVSNCGAETLNSVTVVDDNGTPGTPGDDVTVLGPISLAPGASQPYSGAYTPAASPSTDTVTASGTGAITVKKTASATCEVPSPPPAGGEGCTPGFWKQTQHFDSWTAPFTPFTPGTLFAAVFENAFPGKTLLQVLGQGGGGLRALGRHTVAALLNAQSPDVKYDLTTQQVIDMFNAVFPGTNTDYETLKDEFEDFNQQHGAPICD